MHPFIAHHHFHPYNGTPLTIPCEGQRRQRAPGPGLASGRRVKLLTDQRDDVRTCFSLLSLGCAPRSRSRSFLRRGLGRGQCSAPLSRDRRVCTENDGGVDGWQPRSEDFLSLSRRFVCTEVATENVPILKTSLCSM